MSSSPVAVPAAVDASADTQTPPPAPAAIAAAPATAAAPKKRRGRPPKGTRSVSPPPVAAAVAAAIAAATDTEEPVNEPSIKVVKTRMQFKAINLGDEVETNAPADSEAEEKERFAEQLRAHYLAVAARNQQMLEQQQQQAPQEQLYEVAASESGLKKVLDTLSYAGVVWLFARFLGAI